MEISYLFFTQLKRLARAKETKKDAYHISTQLRDFALAMDAKKKDVHHFSVYSFYYYISFLPQLFALYIGNGGKEDYYTAFFHQVSRVAVSNGGKEERRVYTPPPPPRPPPPNLGPSETEGEDSLRKPE